MYQTVIKAVIVKLQIERRDINLYHIFSFNIICFCLYYNIFHWHIWLFLWLFQTSLLYMSIWFAKFLMKWTVATYFIKTISNALNWLLSNFSITNGGIHYKFITLEYHTTWFVKSEHTNKICYTEEQIISMLLFLLNNIFVEFGGVFFQQSKWNVHHSVATSHNHMSLSSFRQLSKIRRTKKPVKSF